MNTSLMEFSKTRTSNARDWFSYIVVITDIIKHQQSIGVAAYCMLTPYRKRVP